MNVVLVPGTLVDVALAFVALEFGSLLSLRELLAELHPLDILGQLLAGALLLIAVRLAVTGADPRWTLLFVSLSLPAHVFDLARRLRGRRRP